MSVSPVPKEAWLTFATPQINNEACSRLFGTMAQIVHNGFTRIHLLIQSSGGFVGDGIAMYNLLRNLPVEIVTYNGGAVESIAVLPYLAGKVRRASKTATFMIHRTGCTLPSRATAEDLKAKVEQFDVLDRNSEEILRLHLTMPDDKWAIHAARDLLISAQEAKEFGIAHEIADFAPIAGAPLVNI
jgi:ATP-dependent Clp protease protease subunit